jgi:hypothetical protein
MNQPNLKTRPEPSRCPVCHLLPILSINERSYWRGGCQTENCAFASIVYQPNFDYAIQQWNDVVDRFLGDSGLLRKGA